MQLIFLGTSAGSPTTKRNVTSHALRFENGRIWFFDCGEGTQHQVLLCSVRPSKIDKIFITHLHGDHWYGLPGMLCEISNAGRTNPLEIICPVGLRPILESILEISAGNLNYSLEFVELSGPVDLGPREPSIASIKVARLKHRVVSYGFILQENERPGRFRVEDAKRAGVTDGESLGKLARGEKIVGADGSTIDGKQLRDPIRPGRKIILLGDTSGSENVRTMGGEGCDWLVHECTFDASLESKARQLGHSSSNMVAAFANAVGAKNLILTHFSGRHTAPDATVTTEDLQAEVANLCQQTNVMIADDLKTFDL